MIQRHPRKVLLAMIALLGGLSLGVSHVRARLNDAQLNEQLIFAYEIRQNTLRELVDYARTHAIDAGPDLVNAVKTVVRPNVRDHSQWAEFEKAQLTISQAAKELIILLDGELDSGDDTFRKLFKRFEAEEQSLGRIRHARLRSSRVARTR